MSTEIVARFYFDDDRLPADELLCRMAGIFSAWPQASGEFRGYRFSMRNRHTVAARHDGVIDVEALCRAAAGRRDPEALLSTTSSFRCWRFQEGRSEPGLVGVWLEAWGDGWTRRNHEDRRIGGEAALSIFDCGPFCAPTEETEDPGQPEINVRIEENLDALTGLLFRLIEALEPRSVKVFTDRGLYLPFNAHLLYFRDVSIVLEDLALIADAWAEGLPAHGVAPLRSGRPEDAVPAFHGWRSAEQREQLHRRLEALLPRREALSGDDVRRVLESGRFDTYSMPVGTSVLEYPDFLNAFLDRFYLEVLEAGLAPTVS